MNNKREQVEEEARGRGGRGKGNVFDETSIGIKHISHLKALAFTWHIMPWNGKSSNYIKLESIVLPESVTYIGSSAFSSFKVKFVLL